MDKEGSHIQMLSTINSRNKDIYQLKKMGKDILCEWKWKKIGVAIFILDKLDFKTKTVIKDNESHYIMKRGQSIKKI